MRDQNQNFIILYIVLFLTIKLKYIIYLKALIIRLKLSCNNQEMSNKLSSNHKMYNKTEKMICFPKNRVIKRRQKMLINMNS